MINKIKGKNRMNEANKITNRTYREKREINFLGNNNHSSNDASL
jgi:hypothetical protein